MRNAISLICAISIWPALGQAADWPDLSSPPSPLGGGEHDAAVVVGVESYFAVPGVPGAKSNAKQWYEYLTETRGVPAQNARFLANEDATREEILDASRKMAGRAGPQGTLWFVFVGHGAPSPDGKDGLLIGVDAQQKAESLEARGLRRQELLKALAQSKAGTIVTVLDACFSGRGQDGAAIVSNLQPLMTVAAAGVADPRMVVLTAAKGNQFAGALPGASRPAFSYLVLGGLRGWAVEGKQAVVTAGDLLRYATNALEATLRGRSQTPDLMGKEDAVVGVSAGEKGPSLAKLAAGTAGGGAVEFHVSALPAVPKANMPSLSVVGGLPRVELPGAMENAGGIDFGSVDVDALGKYDDAVRFEKGDAAPEAKASKWRELGGEVKTYADVAAKRATEWDEYAAQAAFNAALKNDKSRAAPEAKAAKWRELAGRYPRFSQTAGPRAREWERYAEELAAAAAAREKRDELMDKDWDKLGKLLSYSVVNEADKKKFAMTFVQAYGNTLADNPYVAKLGPFLPPGTVSMVGRARVRTNKAGIQWVRIPGGTFTMGSGNGDEGPAHSVTIKTFQMAKTLVTVAQYKACVDAGACTAPNSGGYCNWGVSGRDQHPINCVDWNQAQAFSSWAGGRLPSEAEWEYAAKSAGKERKYPWGDETATCQRAVISEGGDGCGKDSTWPVCSKTAGNTEQGLCDMAGNVWEWVQDWYHGSYNGAPADGSAWESPTGSYRVVRGGSWNSVAGYARSAYRDNGDPGDRGHGLGFRPAH